MGIFFRSSSLSCLLLIIDEGEVDGVPTTFPNLFGFQDNLVIYKSKTCDSYGANKKRAKALLFLWCTTWEGVYVCVSKYISLGGMSSIPKTQ